MFKSLSGQMLSFLLDGVQGMEWLDCMLKVLLNFSLKGFPCGSAGKESACNAGDLGSIYPWVGKILWRRERLPTAVFWPGEFRGLYSPWGSQRVRHD